MLFNQIQELHRGQGDGKAGERCKKKENWVNGKKCVPVDIIVKGKGGSYCREEGFKPKQKGVSKDQTEIDYEASGYDYEASGVPVGEFIDDQQGLSFLHTQTNAPRKNLETVINSIL